MENIGPRSRYMPQLSQKSLDRTAMLLAECSELSTKSFSLKRSSLDFYWDKDFI
jgi:hypothetical protein